jgi:hypothetical protein
MGRILLTALALVAIAAVAAPAAGARARHETVVVKITSPPDFRQDPQCPEFLGVAALTHRDGSPAGTANLCVRKVEFPPNAFVEHARLTLDLQGGTIEIEVTLVDVFRPDGSALHFGWGYVVGGSGRYRGAAGILAAFGRIVFDAQGTPSPDLTYAVHLRW